MHNISEISYALLGREHFAKLLAGDDASNLTDQLNCIPLNNDDNIDPSRRDEVGVAIRRLKNKKRAGADGLSAVLYKASGSELIRCMHQFINKIWLECMLDEWNLSYLQNMGGNLV